MPGLKYLKKISQKISSKQGTASSAYALIMAPLFFLMLVLCLYWAYASHGSSMIFNSDFLYPESLFRDLFIDHYPLNGWLVSKAPFFFPDWALYFLLRLVGLNYAAAWAMYVVIDFSLLLLFFYGVLRLFYPQAKNKNLLLYVIGWGALLVLLIHGAPEGVGMQTFVLIACHSGALLNSLFLLWLWVRSLTSPLKLLGLFFLSLFCILATLSDLWWVPWAGIPIGLTTLLLIGYKKLDWRIHFPFLLALGLGTVAGQVLLEVIQKNKWLYFSQVAVGTAGLTIVNQLKIIGHDTLDLIKASPLWLILFVASLALCFKTLSASGQSKKVGSLSDSSHQTTAFLALHIATLFSFVVSFFIIVPFKLWALWNYRYITPVLFLPWIIVGLHLFKLRDQLKYFSIIYLFPAFLFLSLLFAQLTAVLSGFDKHHLGFIAKIPYTPAIACLDEVARADHLKMGAGEYWYGKSLTNTSRAGLRINQFTYDFDLLFWVSNLHWFINPSKNTPVQYDFIVSSPSITSWQRFQNIVGAPSAVRFCADLGIFVYTGEKRKLLNEILASRTRTFFNKMNIFTNKGLSILQNGSFETSSQFWNHWSIPDSPTTFARKTFDMGMAPPGTHLQHYALWKVNGPVQAAFLDQRFNNIQSLAGKSLALTFWARSLSGKQNFASQAYLVPQGLLDGTANFFHSDLFALDHHWKKIVVYFDIPHLTNQKVLKNAYALIRPLYFDKGEKPRTVELADIQLFANSTPHISEKDSNNYVPVSVAEVPLLIAKADQSRLRGNFIEEYQYLKSAETATPENAALLARFTRQASGAKMNKKLEAALLWRLSRAEYNLAKGDELAGHMYLAAYYAHAAYKLSPNAVTTKWWAVTNMDLGSLGTFRQKNNGIKEFPKLIAKAMALDPYDAELYALMGKWQYDHADPRLVTTLALMLSSESPPKGSYKIARNYFEHALSLDSKNADYQQWLKRVDKRTGRSG